MNSNFYEDFKDHSNEELISIIRQIGAHQPEAIAAAYKHLSERQVSDNEVFGVPATLQTVVSEDGQEDLLVPYLQETTAKPANKWINIILSLIAFLFFYRIIYLGWYFYKYSLDLSSLLNYSYIFSFGFLLILFLLIYKRKKWGWYILFASHTINIIATGGLYVKGLIHGFTENFFSVVEPAIFGAISLFVAYILWKEEVAHDFAISRANKQTALIVGIFLGIFVLVTRYMQT